MSGLTIPFTGLKKQYNNLRTEILEATDEVLRSGQLMNGNQTAEFENWLSQKNHSKYAVTCHSGTHALEIIASYYRDAHVVNPPRVLIPTLTYAATANAFARAGWDIHFIDTDRYGILNPETIPNVSYQALVLIGLYGASVDRLGEQYKRWPMKSIDTGTTWIEDGAQHWLSDNGQRCGNATAISFDPMKNLNAYGNGGAVVTDDLNLMEYARAWRDNGKSQHQIMGTNSRMSELDASQMLVKTRYIDAWQQRRQEIATYWIGRLKKTPVRCLIDDKNFEGHAFHKFVIEVDNRDLLQQNLAIKKIETRVHYKEPLHELGVFRQYPGPDFLCNASSLARRVLSLPLYPELTDLEVEYVIDQLIDLVVS